MRIPASSSWPPGPERYVTGLYLRSTGGVFLAVVLASTSEIKQRSDPFFVTSDHIVRCQNPIIEANLPGANMQSRPVPPTLLAGNPPT